MTSGQEMVSVNSLNPGVCRLTDAAALICYMSAALICYMSAALICYMSAALICYMSAAVDTALPSQHVRPLCQCAFAAAGPTTWNSWSDDCERPVLATVSGKH